MAAAVRAANAAEAAAAGASDWRAGSFEEEDDEDATGATRVFLESRGVRAKSLLPAGSSVPESSDAANNVVANPVATRGGASALLRDAHVSEPQIPEPQTRTALDDAFDASDAF